MTTERKPVRPKRAAPALTLSPLEWRLWVTAALAGGYALVWLALSPRVRPATEPAPAEPLPTQAPQIAWIAELPPAERPVVVIPDGWTLDTDPLRASHADSPRATTPAVARSAPRIIRVRSSRPARVRTRSS